MHLQTVTVPDELIAQAHKKKPVEIKQVKEHNPTIHSNDYVILRSRSNPKATALVRHISNGVCQKIMSDQDLEFEGIFPRDAKQSAFADALVRPEILICGAIGEAGTGKTSMALGYALSMYRNTRRPIYLSKPTTLVGESQAWGAVPGEVQDKYKPYIQSFEMAFSRLLGSQAKSYMESMARTGDLQFFPVELMRGNEFSGCTFIADELQNWTWHQTKTLISRLGKDAKLIITGDPSQSDLPTGQRSGLDVLLSSPAFASSTLSSCIWLTTQYRSPLATLVKEIDDWAKTSK